MSTRDGSIPAGDEQGQNTTTCHKCNYDFPDQVMIPREDGGELCPVCAGKVELIAAGYEWVCPVCDLFNRVIEVTETVTCPGCDTTYKVQDYHHATG